MARVSLETLRQQAFQVNQARLDATTDANIEEQARADDEATSVTAGSLLPVLPPSEVRLFLRMSQTEFAEALLVPVGTIRNWEQGRSLPDPAARSLLNAVHRAPRAVLTALNPSRRDAWMDLDRRIRKAESEMATGHAGEALRRA